MVRLTGLDVSEFVHPDGKTTDSLTSSRLIKTLASAPTMVALATKLLGSYVRVSERDMPELYGMLREVCETLDYRTLPEIYLHRSEALEWKIYLDETPIIVLTDFVLNDFDDEMLKFHLGCAVTSLKANTCQLRMLANFGDETLLAGKKNLLTKAAISSITKWSRGMVLTEDRGGLLACQNREAAYRYLMRLTGLPRYLIDTSCVPDYIDQYLRDEKNSLFAAGGKLVDTLDNFSPWRNERLLHLYQWVNSGEYNDLIEKYC